jgi:predicted Zn-dependent protease
MRSDVPAAPKPSRRPALIAGGAILLALAAVALALSATPRRQLARGVDAFAAGRLHEAELLFQDVLRRAPDQVTARLYLARIHRRRREFPEAAGQLRAAVRTAPGDPHLRRELGYLFFDLDQPQAAVEQFRRALDEAPEDARSWIGWIRALRMAGDPLADEVLRRAPAEVQAALARRD